MQLSEHTAHHSARGVPLGAQTLGSASLLEAHQACDEETPHASFSVRWARTADEIGEAQRLRYRVFAEEMGASLRPMPGAPPGHDIDRFDAFCSHLVVRAQNTARRGEVIGTCRVLTPSGARRAGRLYCDSEFDLAPLRDLDLLPHTMEMGRVCVDAAWRNGLVVMALWRELGDCMLQQGVDAMIGCSSVSMSDGGELATRLWHRLRQTHLAAPALHVRPWAALPLPLFAGADDVPTAVPALIKGYLRCGGKLLGPPAVDEAFNTADFPMMLQLHDMPARYSRRIFGASA